MTQRASVRSSRRRPAERLGQRVEATLAPEGPSFLERLLGPWLWWAGAAEGAIGTETCGIAGADWAGLGWIRLGWAGLAELDRWLG